MQMLDATSSFSIPSLPPTPIVAAPLVTCDDANKEEEKEAIAIIYLWQSHASFQIPIVPEKSQ